MYHWMTDMPSIELAGKVQTVAGMIDPGALGITLPHEHLLVDLSSCFAPPEAADDRQRAYQKVGIENLSWLRYHPFQNLDNLRMLDEQEAVDEALLFRHAGGGTIVDCTINGIGRDPDALVRIARAAGVNVIMGSGYYTAPAHGPEIHGKSEDDIFAEIVNDITAGVGGSGVRSGFIGEIGLSWPIEANERKVLHAAIRAQRETGACLSIHPGRNEGSTFEIVDIVRKMGGDLSRVIMCHIDVRVRDAEHRLKLAESGCVLEYDVFGWEGHFPSYWTMDDYMDMPNDTTRIQEIRALIDAGHLEQILISQDICRKSTRVCYGGWGYVHILKYVVPMMRQRGVTQKQIDAIMTGNPRRLFTFV